MRDKLKSKLFQKSLGDIKKFIEGEVKKLNELKEKDVESYHKRVRELGNSGFVIHSSQFTYEVLGISFGFTI